MIWMNVYQGAHMKPDAETVVQEMPRRLERRINEIICRGRPGARIDPARERWAYLHRVWVRAGRRRSGLGAEVLERTLLATDALQLTLVLRVAPFDARGLTVRRLRRWYERFDFQTLEGELMVRPWRMSLPE